MIYLYVVEKANIYRYVIYLFAMCILMIVNNIYLKKKLKDSYVIGILLLSMIIATFTYEIGFIITVIITLLAISIEYILNKIKNFKKIIKTEKSYFNNLPIGFYMSCISILSMIIINTFACRW